MDGTHICFCRFLNGLLENSPFVCSTFCLVTKWMMTLDLDGTVGKLSGTLRACVTPWNNKYTILYNLLSISVSVYLIIIRKGSHSWEFFQKSDSLQFFSVKLNLMGLLS